MFATYGQTESCDDLPVILWRHDPTREEVNAAYKELLPEEFSEVGFVTWYKVVPEVRD